MRGDYTARILAQVILALVFSAQTRCFPLGFSDETSKDDLTRHQHRKFVHEF